MIHSRDSTKSLKEWLMKHDDQPRSSSEDNAVRYNRDSTNRIVQPIKNRLKQKFNMADFTIEVYSHVAVYNSARKNQTNHMFQVQRMLRFRACIPNSVSLAYFFF